MAECLSAVPPDHPAVRRAHELAYLISMGDRGAARSYAEQHYAADFLRIPMAVHLGFISFMHDQTRGIAIVGVYRATSTTATILIRDVLTDIVQGLDVEVEADPPHRITSIGVEHLLSPAASVVPSPLNATSITGLLQPWLDRLADADVFSGVVGVAKDGQLLFAQAYGMANKDFAVPNTLDTACNLGSMNKMFTAVAIAQLAEQGRLSFTDALATYLPDFPTTEAAERIQIRHLLSHTSGLGSYFTEQFEAASRVRFRTIDDFLALVRHEPLLFAPGTRWEYSNTGFLVLGAVIEAITGQDYFTYMRTQLYEPLGMHRTEAYELDRVNWNLAVGYEKEFTDMGVVFRNNLFEHVIRGGPAGGGYSTVGDLVRFATALHSSRLLSSATTELLLTSKPELGSPAYGYGFSIEPGHTIIGHGGGFSGISSNLDIFRDSGYVAVVLSNYGRASEPVVAKLRQLILASGEAQSPTPGGLLQP
jgi:CubicO group peptidase (beta-lactamase class C family)